MRRTVAACTIVFAAQLAATACGNGGITGINEKGVVETINWTDDAHTQCTFTVHRKDAQGDQKQNRHTLPLPGGSLPAYDSDVCRMGAPVRYILYTKDRVEVTYQVKYRVDKAASTSGKPGCEVGFTALDTGWPNIKVQHYSPKDCTGYISGGAVIREHTAPGEGRPVA